MDGSRFEGYDENCRCAPARSLARLPSTPGLLGFHDLSERTAVFTPQQVRELDRATIEDIGVPGPVLMERAALGVSALVQSRYPGPAHPDRLWTGQQRG